ncbi:MAG: hypothetical protein AAF616_12735 [Bacteroidota bacterium]
MKKILACFLIGFFVSSFAEAQIRLKNKAERKANQVIDDFLFGKKKKKNQDNGQGSGDSSGSSTGTGSGNNTVDDYTPSNVDFGSLDFTQSISFRTLIDMLPERTQGFSRSAKPEGSRFSMQGASFSTAEKQYSNGDRNLQITLNDYLGAEFLAAAYTSQQYEYESTDGIAKSIEVDGIPGWINLDYNNNSGTIFLFLEQRFFTSVQADNTSESELKAIASDVNLGRLKRKISE